MKNNDRAMDVVRVKKEIAFKQDCFVMGLDTILKKETVMLMPYDAEKRMQWIRDSLASFKREKEKLLVAHERAFPD